MGDVGVPLATWLPVVRRARLGRTVKAVAFAIAGYANNDGTHVYPGIARLSVECEVSTKVVKESLAALRSKGLIELVRAAKKPGETNEYRLILAEDVLEKLELPSPAAHELEIRRRSDQIRGKHKPNLRGTAVTAESAESDDLRGSCDTAESDIDEEPAGNGEGAEPEPAGNLTDNLRGTAFPPNSHRPRQETTTSHTEDHVRTDLTVPRARCPTHQYLDGGERDDGQPRCPVCRREARTDGRPQLRVIEGGAA